MTLALTLTTLLGGEVAGQDDKGSPGSDGASPYHTDLRKNLLDFRT
jgi:hypothetical protein